MRRAAAAAALALGLSSCVNPPQAYAVPIDHALAVQATPDSSRTSARFAGKRWAKGDWKRFPKRIERAALCVSRHESWHAGLWRARNGDPGTTASGAFQWIDSTWRTHAKRAGVKKIPPRAYLASPRKQARVFAHNWPTSKTAWYGTGCYPGSPTW